MSQYRFLACLLSPVFCLLFFIVQTPATSLQRREASGSPRHPSAAAALGTPPTREVRVAAAADLRFALDEIITGFRQQHPDIAVTPTYGSSGNFHSQLINRAPFDIYVSADVVYPWELAGRGLALPGSEFVYAVGHIVIWVPRASPIDLQRLGVAALGHDSVRHIAIANPRHAPYGQAAEAAMRSLGIYDAVKEKLVFGDNVAQTLQFVQSGAAQIGVVALSLALAPVVRDEGMHWEIPLGLYPRMDQGGIILKWARDPEAAKSFRAHLLGDEGRRVLKRHGFSVPGE
jgi:molybdate transport system substrate-binding protein